MKACIKHIFLAAMGTLGVFFFVTMQSCNEDKCKSIVCAYGGVCKEGTCICPAGYEGSQCETITRQRYQGVWIVEEEGTSSMPARYEVNISYGTTMTDILITNFYNKIKVPVEARIKGDTMFIHNQIRDGYKINGIGILGKSLYYGENGVMNVRYTIEAPDGTIDDYGLNGGHVSIWNH